MFKKGFWQNIIPDIIIALGFFLLLMGIFNQQQNNAPLQTNEPIENDILIGYDLEIEEPLQTNEPVQKELDSKENLGIESPPADNVLQDIVPDLAEEEEQAIERLERLVEVEAEEVKLISIVIPEGSTGRQVARILDEAGLVSYDDFIELLLLFDIETRIKAGDYTFSNDSGLVEILTRILIKGGD